MQIFRHVYKKGDLSGRFCGVASATKKLTMTTIKDRITNNAKSNKWAYFITGLLLLFCLYLLVARFLDGRRQEQALQQLQEQAEQVVRLNAEKQLRLMVKTLVWAVRSAQIRDNLDEVNQYFYELVKEPNVKVVVLANRQGQIVVATNKKLEGKTFSDLFPADALQLNDVAFSQRDSIYQIAAPVMALTSKLGTLYIQYDAPEVKTELVPEEN